MSITIGNTPWEFRLGKPNIYSNIPTQENVNSHCVPPIDETKFAHLLLSIKLDFCFIAHGRQPFKCPTVERLQKTMKALKDFFKSFEVVKTYNELTEAEKKALDKGAARNRRAALYDAIDGQKGTFLGCEFTESDKLLAFKVGNDKIQIPSYLFKTQRLWKSETPIKKASLEDIRKCQPEPLDGVLKGLTPDDYKFDELGYEMAVSKKLTDKDGNGVTITFKTVSYKNAIGFWEGEYYTTDQRKCVVMESATAEQSTTEQPKTRQ